MDKLTRADTLLQKWLAIDGIRYVYYDMHIIFQMTNTAVISTSTVAGLDPTTTTQTTTFNASENRLSHVHNSYCIKLRAHLFLFFRRKIFKQFPSEKQKSSHPQQSSQQEVQDTKTTGDNVNGTDLMVSF